MSVSKEQRREVRNMFAAFLLAQDCYDQFTENMELNHGFTSLLLLIDMCANTNTTGTFALELVNQGFYWSGAPEGALYWVDIAKAWKKHYNTSPVALQYDKEKKEFNSIW